MNTRNVSSWDRSATEVLNPLVTRRMIRTPMVTILRMDFKKGAVFPAHQHVHEQITIVETGKMKIEIDGSHSILGPGDILRVPPSAPHYTEALEDSTTTEIFCPAREDMACPDSACLID